MWVRQASILSWNPVWFRPDHVVRESQADTCQGKSPDDAYGCLPCATTQRYLCRTRRMAQQQTDLGRKAHEHHAGQGEHEQEKQDAVTVASHKEHEGQH